MRFRTVVFVFLISAVGLGFVPKAWGAKTQASSSELIRYRYLIDPRRSRVSFTFRGPVLPFDAHFALLRGEIFLGSNRRNPFAGATGWLEIETGSVKVAAPPQRRMIRNEIFEVGRFPKAELRVKQAKPAGRPLKRGRERDWEVRARGVLRLHGVERPVEFTFKLADTGSDIYIRGRGDLRLSDFGMARPRTLLLVPGRDEVEVSVRLVATPKPN